MPRQSTFFSDANPFIPDSAQGDMISVVTPKGIYHISPGKIAGKPAIAIVPSSGTELQKCIPNFKKFSAKKIEASILGIITGGHAYIIADTQQALLTVNTAISNFTSREPPLALRNLQSVLEQSSSPTLKK